MEKYMILIECEEQCIDLECEFSFVDDFYTVKITDPFDSICIIAEDNERQCYAEAARYILDKGRIISIIPLIEKHPFNFFRIYIRIEEINRHLSGIKRNFY
jgi:hypothetical protein